MSGTDSNRLGVVFAGGGTGGHLYPALAIAEQLGEHCSTHYLCSGRPLDSKILTDEGVGFSPLRASSPVLNPTQPRAMLRFVAGWGPSVRQTRSVIRDLKSRSDRVVMVTMGGFVAPPAVQGARAESIPVLMVNLDAVPGRANRFISGRVDRIVTAIAVPGRRWDVVPPVVRRELREPRDAGGCRASFGLDPGLRTLLITGGSQGARSVGRFAIAVGEEDRSIYDGWQVIHQAGSHDGDVDEFTGAWADLGVRAHVVNFLGDMPSAWWGADLHLGRCGAGTVAECWATRTPSVFMPYPWHKDMHQRHNAAGLHEAGAAVLIDDRIEPGANLEDHGGVLGGLLSSPAALDTMGESLGELGPADGAERVAGLVRAMGAPGPG